MIMQIQQVPTVKAITLWEPWGSAIIRGLKEIETRGRRTSHRGTLLIHTAKTRDYDVYLYASPLLKAVFASVGITKTADLVFGHILGAVDLYDVTPTEHLRHQISEQERALGNYDDGRQGWLLRNVRRFKTPVPYPGSQCMFNVPIDVVPELKEVA